MSSRLYFAIFISLAAHSILLQPGLLKFFAAAKPRPVLQARLRLPPVPEIKPEEAAEETILKNTMDSDETKPIVKPDITPEKQSNTKNTRHKQDVQAAQRKISERLFYPPEAIAQGIEGDVWLILKLTEDGGVDDVSVATSSGYSLLDNAAIKAAYAMGRQKGISTQELLVPVHFRLED